jgi:hypothetical protein
MNIKTGDIVKIKGDEREWAVIDVEKKWSKSDQAHLIDRIEVFDPEQEESDPDYSTRHIALDQVESIRKRPTLNVGDYVYYDSGSKVPSNVTLEDYARNGSEIDDSDWEDAEEYYACGTRGVIRELLDNGECWVECTWSHAYGDEQFFVVTLDRCVFAVSRFRTVIEKKYNQVRTQAERRPLSLPALAILVGAITLPVLLLYLIDYLR